MQKIIKHVLSNVVFQPCKDHETTEYNYCLPTMLKCNCSATGNLRHFNGEVDSNGRPSYTLKEPDGRGKRCFSVPYIICDQCESRTNQIIHQNYAQVQSSLHSFGDAIGIGDLEFIVWNYLFKAIVRCPFCV